MVTETAGEADGGTCPSCGATRLGRYCADCGQRFLDGRHNLRTLAGGILERTVSLERGFVRTLGRLTTDPGPVVRDYLAGRTITYVHPFAYLVVGFGAFALTFRWMGGVGGGSVERLLLSALVLFLAAASRIVFWRAGLNYAEHLIMNMFLYAQAVLFLTVGMVVVWVLPGVVQRVAGVVVIGAAFAYVVWAYSRVFRGRRLLAALGGLLAVVAGIGMWAVLGVVFAQWARR